MADDSAAGAGPPTAAVLAELQALMGPIARGSLIAFGMAADGTLQTGRGSMPARPGAARARRTARRLVSAVRSRAPGMTAIAAAAYGTHAQVAPVAAAVRAAAAEAGLRVADIVRVDGGRYWSLEHGSPAEGEPVAAAKPPAVPVPSPGHSVPGQDPAAAAGAAWLRHAAAGAVTGQDAFAAAARAGIETVEHAIGLYRDGNGPASPHHLTRLSFALSNVWTHLDAYARMNPLHASAHIRLWADATSRAAPGLVPGPASLLAYTAMQAGDTALARSAAAQALGDRDAAGHPGYMLAVLSRDLAEAGSGAGHQPEPAPHEVARMWDAMLRPGTGRHRPPGPGLEP